MSYRNALITGASSGLGRGLSIALAKDGAHVIVAARRKPQLEGLVDEIKRAGGSAEAIALDVAASDATEQAVRELDSRVPLDLVIANAGVGGLTDAKTPDWKMTKQIFEVNVLGAAATITGALPGMVARHSGHIVGIASLAGFRGLPRFSVYSASKSALMTLLEGFRVDLVGSGVDVTTICPGYVKTEMTAKNSFKMPFLLELDEAVDIMMRALRRRDALCAFPRPMAFGARSLSFMPNSIYDFIARRAAPTQ